MSYSYYPQALLQEMLHISNLHSLQRLQQEVQELKEAIYSKQKKHRRCDKDISKNVTCPQCQRVYASTVALKLHLKLKHAGLDKHSEDRSTSHTLEEQISVSQA